MASNGLLKNDINNLRKCYTPWRIFEGVGKSHVVIVLNTPLCFDHTVSPLILQLWNNAILRITVDGGTDRFLEWTKLMNITDYKPPDLITGDLDSIEQQTLDYFKGQTDVCSVVYTEDQNHTDFTKAIIELAKHIEAEASYIDGVFALSDMSGRFDQVVSTINTLFHAQTILSGLTLYILSPTSIVWLLEDGYEHYIEIPHILQSEQKCCGLLPIGGSCKVTSMGLKWDLSDTILEFGKVVSSSNTYNIENNNQVIIKCDKPLVWTMEIDSYMFQIAMSNTMRKNAVTST